MKGLDKPNLNHERANASWEILLDVRQGFLVVPSIGSTNQILLVATTYWLTRKEFTCGSVMSVAV
jgi:hypothetical protein